MVVIGVAIIYKKIHKNPLGGTSGGTKVPPKPPPFDLRIVFGGWVWLVGLVGWVGGFGWLVGLVGWWLGLVGWVG